MKLYFFRGEHPNFGDELNSFLMPKVFPGLFDDSLNEIFLGIGSVLYDHHPTASQKVVFGTGYGGYTPPPQLDSKWRIYCVRGPLTAQILNLPEDKVAADSAILINRHRPRRKHAGKVISFMPHWKSMDVGRWQQVCALCGISLIDPRQSVEQVLDQIEASSVLLSEAMHGAIVADALRIPWIPLQPIDVSNRPKWHDWAAALGIKLPIHSLFPSSSREMTVKFKQQRNSAPNNPARFFGPTLPIVDFGLASLAATRLWQLSRTEPLLSKDKCLEDALDKLETHAASIRSDFLNVPKVRT